ncbi:MAG: hypothetical protein NVSMB13_00040 [Mycobacteriales bacterium]
MVTYHDLYGTTMTQAELRGHVERLLSIVFTARDSWYWGGDYYSFEAPDGVKLVIRNNKDIDPGELAEPDFPDSPILFDVTQPDNRTTADILATAIPGLIALKSSVFS